MNNKLLIIGAGGHGKVVADIAIKMNLWRTIHFLDDNIKIQSKVLGLEVIGTSLDITKYAEDYEMFVAIGNNKTRESISIRLEQAGIQAPILIHPDAVIGTHVELGAGTVIMAGVVINCCTRIGKGCIVNTGATIDHDSIIEDYVHLSPGTNLGGSVVVGKSSWLGIGSKVVNNVNITSECIVGAGAIVIDDITESGTYVGVPARRLT